MAERHPAKERCFELWKAGKPFLEIERRTRVRLATITGWVKEWERGAQRTWNPEMPHRGGYTGREQN